jgi:hypothetical protein
MQSCHFKCQCLQFSGNFISQIKIRMKKLTWFWEGCTAFNASFRVIQVKKLQITVLCNIISLPHGVGRYYMIVCNLLPVTKGGSSWMVCLRPQLGNGWVAMWTRPFGVQAQGAIYFIAIPLSEGNQNPCCSKCGPWTSSFSIQKLARSTESQVPSLQPRPTEPRSAFEQAPG